ncbi:MAG: hypothetical protein KC457_03975, partial [Myxococcales bacterium]|nr:hypothetical protein [Myxococcales bacterium]
ILPGRQVEPGDILIGKVTPLGDSSGALLSPEEKLLRAIFGEASGEVRDSSLRCPPGCSGTIVSARKVGTQGKGELDRAEVVIGWERPLAVGDELLLEGAGTPRAGLRVIVAAVTSLGGGRRLAWADGAASLRVAKLTMVEDLIHARSIGPYSLVTQQPLGGRESFGGQSVAPPWIGALATRAPWMAWEMFTIKSDSVTGRVRAYEALVLSKDIEHPRADLETPAPSTGSGTTSETPADIFSFFEKPRSQTLEPGDVAAEIPESVEVLARELFALGLEVRFAAENIGVRLLSREALRARSHGQVKNPETINYRTFKPERDGLFCSRIFGPVKDYECLCGKYARMKHRGVVCEKCGVEVVQSKVRRERFGHLDLAAPVVHPLFKDTVACLLRLKDDELDAVLAGTMGLDGDGRYAEVDDDRPGSEAGGVAIRAALAALDLEALSRAGDPARAKVAGALLKQEIEPTAFMIETLAILPPDLRPLVPLDGGRFATSDLNDLYRRVVSRHNRLARLIELAAPRIILRNEFGELQRTVEQLFMNEATAKPVHFNHRALRSLASMIEVRLHELTRRRVDYSGVSRLVADAAVSSGRCRLPRRMATELFKPMAFGVMESQGHVDTIKSAKAALEQGLDFAVNAIAETAGARPILLVGAGGFTVCEVELWDEATIAVDPATARALRGPEQDTRVTVHVPLGDEARREAAAMTGVQRPDFRFSSGGWLSAALVGGEALDRLREAVLCGLIEQVEDPLLTAALGRGPDAAPVGPSQVHASSPGRATFDEDEDDF